MPAGAPAAEPELTAAELAAYEMAQAKCRADGRDGQEDLDTEEANDGASHKNTIATPCCAAMHHAAPSCSKLWPGCTA